jgi:uncharacterized membrane protein YfcA
METALALIAGGFIGAVLGFVGAGGAMLSVPILLYIFDFTAIPATTGALAIVLLAALAGALPKARAKEILYRDALVIWSLGLVTNLATSVFAHRLSDTLITTGFAIVLLFAASTMLRKSKIQEHRRMSIPSLVLISLGIGALTGVFGIGGGFIVVPVLIHAFGTPPRIATGTSLVVICLNSITAFFGHYSHWHEVDWKYPLIIAASAVVVALLASHKQNTLNSDKSRKLFAGLLICISTFTLIQTWN